VPERALKETPRGAAARWVAVAWVIELVLGVSALWCAGWLFRPQDPWLLELHPHPLLALSALIAVRYGATAGFTAGLFLALTHAALQSFAAPGAIFAGLSPTEIGHALRVVDPVGPLWIAAVGFVLGAVRERQRQRQLHDRWQARAQLREAQTLQANLDVELRARAELERRVVEPAASVALLYEAAQRLEALEEQPLYEAVVETATQHLQADACALYIRGEDGLDLVAQTGSPRLCARLDPSRVGGLVRLALAERRTVSVRDRLEHGIAPADLAAAKDEVEGHADAQDAPDAPGEPGPPRPGDARGRAVPMLVTPISLEDTAPLGLLVVTALPFLRLTVASERILTMLAGWAARAIDNTRYVRSIREKSLVDEELGILRDRYLFVRLPEEIERAGRYGRPVTLLSLQVTRWAGVAEEARVSVLRTVAQITRQCLRRADQVYRRPGDGGVVAVLPATAEGKAAPALGRIAEELDLIALRPYGSRDLLEVTCGLATMLPDAPESPEALLARAEAGATSLTDHLAVAPSEPSEPPEPSNPAEPKG